MSWRYQKAGSNLFTNWYVTKPLGSVLHWTAFVIDQPFFRNIISRFMSTQPFSKFSTSIITFSKFEMERLEILTEIIILKLVVERFVSCREIWNIYYLRLCNMSIYSNYLWRALFMQESISGKINIYDIYIINLTFY